jgi:RNA polymerase sigma factor (sigma-70 family)
MRRGIKKTWLDNRKRELPTEELKEISKSWSLKTWKDYAYSLDHPASGLQLAGRGFKKISSNLSKSIFDIYSQRPACGDLQAFIQGLLGLLSKRERQIIELIFFEGRSTEEVAAKFEVSKSTIQHHKKNAISKLQAAMPVTCDDLSIVRGKENFDNSELTREEEIYEVMQEDIRRF